MRILFRQWPGRARWWAVGSLLAAIGSLLFPTVARAQGADNPQPPPNWIVSPGSPIATTESNLFTIIFAMALVVFVLVEGLLIVSAVRFRRREGDTAEPPQIFGHQRLEVAWTIMPALVLVVVLVFTLQALERVSTPPDGPATQLQIIGHQWFWEARYTDAGNYSVAGGPDTPLVITVPVGSLVKLDITSADVIHSLWVPELAGKTDANPNMVNHAWFIANEAKTYQGQCAEYCGTRHSRMFINVVAVSQDQFTAWFTAVKQKQALAQGTSKGGPVGTDLRSPPLPPGDAQRGQALFQGQAPGLNGSPLGCNVCHSTQPNVTIVGPSLFGVWDRASQRVKAPDYHGKATNQEEYIRESEVQPSAYVAPGFPDVMLKDFGQRESPQDLADIIAYLQTLK